MSRPGHVAIVGAGTMGVGISGVFASKGMPTVLVDSTGELAEATRDLSVEAFRADVPRRMPMGRIDASSEVDGAVVFLAFRQAALVPGHVLGVDGGRTAW